MKRFTNILIALVLIANSISAQVSPNHYLINFTDKNNSTYSINNPQEFLSQRAINRKSRYNISIDLKDIPVNKSYIDSLKKLGLKIINVSKWLNSATVYSTDIALIDTIDKISFVKSVGIEKKSNKIKTENTLEKKSIGKSTTDTVNSNYFDYGISLNQSQMLNGNLLHNEGFRGEGMQIAILDAGFYKVNELPAFDSLRINNQILGVWDFVDGDNQVYDADTHGMKVLSTMAGNISGQLIGTAPKAKYWLLRTEQGASEYIIEEHNWVVAAEFADSAGVDVINSSLGYNDFDDNINSHTYQEMDGNSTIITIGADIAASKGILVVTSAGNEGFSSWQYITAPADADSVLTVGAVTPEKTIAYFSSLGPTSDKRIKPDVCAQGMPAVVEGSGGEISYANGTSFSSPIMAGMVTCLWQAHPELNNMQIIDAVKRSANKYSKPDTIYGYGIPDFYAAHLYLKSSGLIDVKKTDFLNVYPNPFKNSFNVEFIAKSINPPFDLEFSVYNFLGSKLLFHRSISTQNNYTAAKIDLNNNFTKGLYIFQIKANNLIMQKKLLKM
ncbi:MAG: S8 family serine peptidase [Bacteroidales bacterium]|nr:S8 family serine peptidase [Bacteroidales bacterium]MBN2756885.1 S8 family serine peptidase [Bacteroidales bacterium]